MSKKAYVAFFDTIEDVLRVYELSVKPWGKHEVMCERPCPAFGFKSRVPTADVYPTPEVAVVVWQSRQKERVEKLERSLERARAELNKGSHSFYLTTNVQNLKKEA